MNSPSYQLQGYLASPDANNHQTFTGSSAFSRETRKSSSHLPRVPPPTHTHGEHGGQVPEQDTVPGDMAHPPATASSPPTSTLRKNNRAEELKSRWGERNRGEGDRERKRVIKQNQYNREGSREGGSGSAETCCVFLPLHTPQSNTLQHLTLTYPTALPEILKIKQTVPVQPLD